MTFLSGVADRDAVRLPSAVHMDNQASHWPFDRLRANFRLPRSSLRSRRRDSPARLRRESLRRSPPAPTNARSPHLPPSSRPSGSLTSVSLKTCPPDAWKQRGIANDNEISVRAIAYASSATNGTTCRFSANGSPLRSPDAAPIQFDT